MKLIDNRNTWKKFSIVWKLQDYIESSKNTLYKITELSEHNKELNSIYHDHITNIHFTVDDQLHIHQHYYPNTKLLPTIHYQPVIIKPFLDILLTGDLFIITYNQLFLNHRHQLLNQNKNNFSTTFLQYKLLLFRPSDKCQKSQWTGSIIKEESDHDSIPSLSRMIDLEESKV